MSAFRFILILIILNVLEQFCCCLKIDDILNEENPPIKSSNKSICVTTDITRTFNCSNGNWTVYNPLKESITFINSSANNLSFIYEINTTSKTVQVIDPSYICVLIEYNACENCNLSVSLNNSIFKNIPFSAYTQNNAWKYVYENLDAYYDGTKKFHLNIDVLVPRKPDKVQLEKPKVRRCRKKEVRICQSEKCNLEGNPFDIEEQNQELLLETSKAYDDMVGFFLSGFKGTAENCFVQYKIPSLHETIWKVIPTVSVKKSFRITGLLQNTTYKFRAGIIQDMKPLLSQELTVRTAVPGIENVTAEWNKNYLKTVIIFSNTTSPLPRLISYNITNAVTKQLLKFETIMMSSIKESKHTYNIFNVPIAKKYSLTASLENGQYKRTNFYQKNVTQPTFEGKIKVECAKNQTCRVEVPMTSDLECKNNLTFIVANESSTFSSISKNHPFFNILNDTLGPKKDGWIAGVKVLNCPKNEGFVFDVGTGDYGNSTVENKKLLEGSKYSLYAVLVNYYDSANIHMKTVKSVPLLETTQSSKNYELVTQTTIIYISSAVIAIVVVISLILILIYVIRKRNTNAIQTRCTKAVPVQRESNIYEDIPEDRNIVVENSLYGN